MTMKVYSTASGRRATTDLEACADAGHMRKAPRYNTLLSPEEQRQHGVSGVTPGGGSLR